AKFRMEIAIPHMEDPGAGIGTVRRQFRDAGCPESPRDICFQQEVIGEIISCSQASRKAGKGLAQCVELLCYARGIVRIRPRVNRRKVQVRRVDVFGLPGKASGIDPGSAGKIKLSKALFLYKERTDIELMIGRYREVRTEPKPVVLVHAIDAERGFITMTDREIVFDIVGIRV